MVNRESRVGQGRMQERMEPGQWVQAIRPGQLARHRLAVGSASRDCARRDRGLPRSMYALRAAAAPHCGGASAMAYLPCVRRVQQCRRGRLRTTCTLAGVSRTALRRARQPRHGCQIERSCYTHALMNPQWSAIYSWYCRQGTLFARTRQGTLFAYSYEYKGTPNGTCVVSTVSVVIAVLYVDRSLYQV